MVYHPLDDVFRFSTKGGVKMMGSQELEDTDAPPMVEQDDQREPVEETPKGGEDDDKQS